MDIRKWVKGEGSGAATRFSSEDTPVSDTMIWLCEKCGAKVSGDRDDNPSRLVQKALKRLVSDNKRKGQIRAMVTSCMNICPSDKIAAGIVDLKGGSTRFVSFEFRQDVDQLAADLYRQI